MSNSPSNPLVSLRYPCNGRRYDLPKRLDRWIKKSDAAYHALIKKHLATARAEIAGGTPKEVRVEIARRGGI
jgi:hypothetical protein